MTTPDESWPLIEEAVFHLFDDLTAENSGDHVALGPPLEELGWSDIEAEYPIPACELLFRAQGRALAHTDCLDRVMLAELGPVLDEPVDGVILPTPSSGDVPNSTESAVDGVLLGPLSSGRRLAVPVITSSGGVSVGVVDSDDVTGTRMDTFDTSAHWSRVRGPLDVALLPASAEWTRAVAAARRGLATELLALSDEALRLAAEHVSARQQFGAPIGSFQSPRHLLAEATAVLEGARALLSQSWRYGGSESAVVAKIAAGRAHRAVSDATLQVCGAIGLTLEHDLHRYVARGFQIDALGGSYQHLEARLAERLFDIDPPGSALPALVACAD